MPKIEPTIPAFTASRRLPHEPLPAAVHFLPPVGDGHKPVRLFVEERLELLGALRGCQQRLPPGTEVWVSWPKSGSQLPTNITEALVREVAARLGFVNVRSSAPSEVWALLKMEMPADAPVASTAHAGRSLTLVEEGYSGHRA